VKPHLTIYRMFTKKVSDLGFTQKKTAWWQRQRGLLLQGIHLHKFSYTTSFRVHAAIHLAEFEPDAPWLNGLSSYDGWYEEGDASVLRRSNPPVAQRYSFDFTESSGSWQPCADELFAFTRDVLIPWFDRWADMERLLSDPHSPLTHDQKMILNRA
jgi:uncharacterized protein DUF4304